MVNYAVPALDRVFHALAHPARRAIIRQLSEGERNLSELASPLRMTFPAATKHVARAGAGAAGAPARRRQAAHLPPSRRSAQGGDALD
ncbi:MAG: helix-turn-helix domain-containing protein [Phycisphaerales bacterium]